MAAAPSGASPSAPTPTSLHARDDNDRLAAGGLRITLPAVTAQPSYYKIAPHESVTFGWQFTSLSKTPDRLYVMASCQANGNTYPIAPSPSGIPGDATQVTWYPYGYHLDAQAQGLPDLAGATYRLLIFDDKGPDGVPKGGEFQANNMAQFAMYFPQAYTPLAGTHIPLIQIGRAFRVRPARCLSRRAARSSRCSSPRPPWWPPAP